MNIGKYRFESSDLVVVTAVNACLKNLKLEARRETLAEVIRQNGAETVIDGPALATLIESAKVAAMIDSETWSEGEGVERRIVRGTDDGKKSGKTGAAAT